MVEGASLFQPTGDVGATLADSHSVQNRTSDYYRSLLDSQPVSSMKGLSAYSWGKERTIDPLRLLKMLIDNDGKRLDTTDYEYKNLTLLEIPRHGNISIIIEDGREIFHYDPIPDYEGDDSISFTIEFEGMRYLFVVKLCVEPLTGNGSEDDCYRKHVDPDYHSDDYNTPASWYRATSLYALLATGDVRATLAMEEGAVEMLMLGLADMPLQEPVVIMAKNEVKQERAIGICMVVIPPYVEPISESGEHLISPVGDTTLYLFKQEKLTHAVMSKYFETAKVTWLELPKHGKLFDKNNKVASVFEDQYYFYVPDAGYRGEDRIVAMVEIMGYKIKVIYYLHDRGSEGYEDRPCKDYSRIISQPTVEDYNDPASWYRATSLYALLTGAKDVLSGFADLSGSALGSTTGNKIPLDTNVPCKICCSSPAVCIANT
jgi:hypothetical protein